jgi:hypothetical protein
VTDYAGQGKRGKSTASGGEEKSACSDDGAGESSKETKPSPPKESKESRENKESKPTDKQATD